MAQSGYTPISLYFSATGAAVPTAGNLVAGELALNTNDGKLYFKNSSGVVTLLAGSTSGPAGGSTTQVQYNNAGVLAGITGATSNGTALTLVAPDLGSPNTVGTMPAFTLGGTVSGGGNQINNVVIGTSTPLAGAFTTVSATGALTGTTIALSGQTADITNATLALLTLKTTDNGGLSAVKLDGKTGGAAVQAWIVGLNRSGTAGTFDIEDATASTFALTITRATLAAKFGGTLSGGTSGTAYSFSGSAPATSLTLDSSGNLGIGTSSPSGKLEVVGAATSTQYFQRSIAPATESGIETAVVTTGNASNQRAGMYAFNNYATNNATDLIFKSNDTTGSATEQMRIQSNGNVGIGTSSPLGRLDVAFSGAGYSRVRSTSATTAGTLFQNSATGTGDTNGLFVGVDGTSSAYFYNYSNAALVFGVNNTERARIDTSGNLLVGTTTTPTGTGGGRFNVEPGNQNGIAVGVVTTGNAGIDINVNSASAYIGYFRYSGTNVGSITSNGTITVYNTTSDYRLKTVVGAVSDSGSRIDALQPVEYTWNSNGSRTRGFLAHQFQEVYASSVTGTKDAVDVEGKPVYQAMQASTSEVIADLVAELQSLRARVAQLESKP